MAGIEGYTSFLLRDNEINNSNWLVLLAYDDWMEVVTRSWLCFIYRRWSILKCSHQILNRLLQLSKIISLCLSIVISNSLTRIYTDTYIYSLCGVWVLTSSWNLNIHVEGKIECMHWRKLNIEQGTEGRSRIVVEF